MVIPLINYYSLQRHSKALMDDEPNKRKSKRDPPNRHASLKYIALRGLKHKVHCKSTMVSLIYIGGPRPKT